MNKTIIQERLEYWQGVYAKLQEAYIALVEGGVKSYMIGDRQLSRYDLDDIREEMEEIEDKIDEYESLLDSGSSRKAVGIIYRDW